MVLLVGVAGMGSRTSGAERPALAARPESSRPLRVAAPASSWTCRWRHRMSMRLATSDRDANMAPVDGPRGEAPSPEPLRVAIVEDDVTTREGLAALINGTPGYRCVGR